MSVYVYGLIGDGRELPEGLTGVGPTGARLRLLRLTDPALGVVVSDAPEGLKARRRDVRAHQRVLTELARTGAVLPMRFGVVLPDEETVRTQLSQQAAAHGETLERLDGRVEFNVKVSPVQDEVALAALLKEDPALRELRARTQLRPDYEANVRLGRAVAEELTRRAGQSAQRVRAALAGSAESTCEGPSVEGCVLNVSYLLPTAAEAAFRELVERLAAAETRVELRLTGPLPCYSFVENAGAPVRAATPARV